MEDVDQELFEIIENITGHQCLSSELLSIIHCIKKYSVYERILNKICEVFEMKKSLIKGSTELREVSDIRSIYMYVSDCFLGRSHATDITKTVCRHRTTLYNSIKVVNDIPELKTKADNFIRDYYDDIF